MIEIVGKISKIDTIAKGNSIRELNRLRKQYPSGKNWRKMKGFARVKRPNGEIKRAEIHWYEAHGIGKKEFKVKYYTE